MPLAHFRDTDIKGVSLEKVREVVQRKTGVQIKLGDLINVLSFKSRGYYFVKKGGYITYSGYEYVDRKMYVGDIGPRLMFRWDRNMIGGKIL